MLSRRQIMKMKFQDYAWTLVFDGNLADALSHGVSHCHDLDIVLRFLGCALGWSKDQQKEKSKGNTRDALHEWSPGGSRIISNAAPRPGFAVGIIAFNQAGVSHWLWRLISPWHARKVNLP